MNSWRLKFGDIVPGIPQFKYLHAAEQLFEFEKSIGIRSTWFFRRITKPHAKFRRKLLEYDCEIAFHADKTANEEEFVKDLKYTMGEIRPLGFSKHGSARDKFEAEERGCEIYDPQRCLFLAKRYGLRYFSGNGVNPDQPHRIVDGVIYFPSAFWMYPGYMDKRYTLEWLMRNHKDKDIVVLIHPREYTDVFPKIKESIERLLCGLDDVTNFYNFIKDR
ncbi:MAG: hypothetical protein QXE79_03235 [Candidatus Bathyarchaeia archaeon]